MKILDVSAISSSVAMPIKAGTLQFLQDANKEVTALIVQSLIPNYTDGVAYILSGVDNTGTAPNYNISAGTVFFNNEIFQVDAVSFTLAGAQLAYGNIVTTQYTTNADPVNFTDGISRNVHNIRKLTFSNTTTFSGVPKFDDFVFVTRGATGEIKHLMVNNAFVTANFDGTGKGLHNFRGWAIPNGNNGTQNIDNRMLMPYGTSNATLLATGGSADTILPAHTHGIQYATATAAPHGGSERVLSNGTFNDGFNTTQSTGTGTGVGANIPPFKVVLMIQKII